MLAVSTRVAVLLLVVAITRAQECKFSWKGCTPKDSCKFKLAKLFKGPCVAADHVRDTPVTQSIASAEDDAYLKRKLVAALKVAQEDLAAEKAKSSHDFVSDFFQLSRSKTGDWQLSSKVPSLCRDDRARACCTSPSAPCEGARTRPSTSVYRPATAHTA